MRHPYEFYAKYLIVTDPKSARERLTLDGCLFDDQSFDELVTRTGKAPNLKHPLSVKALEYAREQQIYGLLTKPDSEDIKHCFRILRQHHIRQTLEILMVMNLTPGSTCSLFLEGTGVDITERQLELYRHYFWNTAIMSRLDWYHFLHELIPTPQGVRTIPRYPNAADIWSALHVDPDLVLAKMGYERYSSLDKSKALDKLFTTAFVKAQEEAAVGNTLGFQKAAGVVIQAYESAKTSTSDVGALLDKLAGRVRMTAVKMEVATLESVTQGRHSEISNVVPLLPKRGDQHAGNEDDQP